jgi:hypothetical protein
VPSFFGSKHCAEILSNILLIFTLNRNVAVGIEDDFGIGAARDADALK